MEKLVIIGSGPAGLTAAVYAARANLNPLLIAGNLPGGLLTQTSEVENFPGFPEGINGFELMLAMQNQAEKFGARIEINTVESVNFSDNAHTITLEDGREIHIELYVQKAPNTVANFVVLANTGYYDGLCLLFYRKQRSLDTSL